MALRDAEGWRGEDETSLSGQVANAHEGGRRTGRSGSFFRTGSFPMPPVGDTTRLSHPLLTVREKRNFWDGQSCVLNKREEEKGGLTPGSSQARLQRGRRELVRTLTVRRGTLPLPVLMTLLRLSTSYLSPGLSPVLKPN